MLRRYYQHCFLAQDAAVVKFETNFRVKLSWLLVTMDERNRRSSLWVEPVFSQWLGLAGARSLVVLDRHSLSFHRPSSVTLC